MAAREDKGPLGKLQKIQRTGSTTVEHIEAADVDELMAGTAPDADVAQRAGRALSGQGMHIDLGLLMLLEMSATQIS